MEMSETSRSLNLTHEDNFSCCIAMVLNNEGGYVNDPNDPGGETKYGISKRAYPNLDIKNLTKEQAVEIYKKDYWTPLHADELPTCLSFALLDFAVHSGVGVAIKSIQRVVNVDPDGQMGPITINAINQQNPVKLLLLLYAERLKYLVNCPAWHTMNTGWITRVADDLRHSSQDIS